MSSLLQTFWLLLLVTTGMLLPSSCQFYGFAGYNYATITDHELLPCRSLTASAPPFQFQTAAKPKAPEKLGLPRKEMPVEKSKLAMAYYPGSVSGLFFRK